jgi:hypothetical protein
MVVHLIAACQPGASWAGPCRRRTHYVVSRIRYV